MFVKGSRILVSISRSSDWSMTSPVVAPSADRIALLPAGTHFPLVP